MREATARRQHLRTALGWLVALACLVWVFHDVQLGTALRGARELRWTWVAMAIAVDILSYMTQGLRWKLLLTPVGRVRWLDATQAIYAGLFASEVLPMRPGEVLRALVVSQRLHTTLGAVLPSVLVERLFDGVWLAAGVGVAAALMPLPADLLRAGDVLGGLILVATGLFLYEILRVRGGRAAAAAASPPGGIERFRRRFQEIGRRRETYLAFGLSLALLAGQIVAFWMVMVAYGLDLGVWVGAAALIVIHLGTAIPNAPANVGTYQFFCVVALTLFGVDKSIASGFSVVVFVVLTVPLWVLGSMAFGRSGATLAGIRAHIGEQPNR